MKCEIFSKETRRLQRIFEKRKFCLSSLNLKIHYDKYVQFMYNVQNVHNVQNMYNMCKANAKKN